METNHGPLPRKTCHPARQIVNLWLFNQGMDNRRQFMQPSTDCLDIGGQGVGYRRSVLADELSLGLYCKLGNVYIGRTFIKTASAKKLPLLQ